MNKSIIRARLYFEKPMRFIQKIFKLALSDIDKRICEYDSNDIRYLITTNAGSWYELVLYKNNSVFEPEYETLTLYFRNYQFSHRGYILSLEFAYYLEGPYPLIVIDLDNFKVSYPVKTDDTFSDPNPKIIKMWNIK